MDDWPTLGQTVHASEKKQWSALTNGDSKQNGTGLHGNHDDSDESQSSQLNNHDGRSKKGKAEPPFFPVFPEADRFFLFCSGSKHKWLPLELDLTKGRRESKSEGKNNENDKEDWNEICDIERLEKNRDNRDSKEKDHQRKGPPRYGNRGRGRSRPARGGGYKQQSAEYSDYPAEYPVRPFFVVHVIACALRKPKIGLRFL